MVGHRRVRTLQSVGVEVIVAVSQIVADAERATDDLATDLCLHGDGRGQGQSEAGGASHDGGRGD